MSSACRAVPADGVRLNARAYERLQERFALEYATNGGNATEVVNCQSGAIGLNAMIPVATDAQALGCERA